MKNKKIVTILSLILLSLFINIRVFAIPEEVITVNGEAAVEITAYGEYTGAIYDSATKTLTLDNYSGDYIVLDFPDGDTVNIVLKGTNNIFHAGGYTGGDINGLGVLSSNENELNINITGETGSKLNISGYYVGIYTYDGYITINNCNIEIINTADCAIYSINGKVNINNSQINIDTAGYGIGSDENVVTLNNVVYTASSIGDDAIYASSFNADKLTGYFNNVGNASEDAIFYTVDIAENKLTNSNINVGTANYFFMGNTFL